MAKSEENKENRTAKEPMNSKKKKKQIGDYFLGKKLGGGATAIVFTGNHVKTGEKAAIKILFKLKEKGVRMVKNELKALGSVKHENVVQLKSVDWNAKYPHKDGSTSDCALIALEICENGELFDYLMHTGSFSEDVARSYFTQLIDGLEACNEAGVVHRDLKPDNLLLDKNFVMKLADFGFASMPEDNDMSTCVGTEKYMAPEVVRGSTYKKSCDIWSCGVILFVMYAGYPPYVAPNAGDWWFDKLLKGNFKYFWMAHEQQRKFDDNFKDLINKMLTADESKRITIAEIRKHPWMTKDDPLKPAALRKELQRRKPQVDTAKLEENLERKNNNSVAFAAGMRAASPGKSIGTTPKSPKLIEMDFKKLPEPEEYEPEVKSYTVVKSSQTPQKSLQYLVSLLRTLGHEIKYHREGFNVECSVDGTSGSFTFDVETYAAEKGTSIIEFRRMGGSFHQFRKYYQFLERSLGPLKPKEVEKKEAKKSE